MFWPPSAGQAASVREGQQTRGIVTGVQVASGLVLQLPDGIRGTVDLTDMSADYHDHPMAKFKTGDVVVGTVMEYNIIAKRAVVSLRPRK